MAGRRTGTYQANFDTTKTTRKNVTVPFNEMNEPGCYYCHQSGWLYRVPEDGLAPGHSPMITVCSADQNFVTKISDDPYTPVGKAREICANWDFFVNF